MDPKNGDRFSVIKRDGRRFDDLSGAVQRTMIILMTRVVIVKPRDLIERNIWHGGKEVYYVVDPQFYDDSAGLTGQYQIKVKLLGAADVALALNTIYGFDRKNRLINQNAAGKSTKGGATDS